MTRDKERKREDIWSDLHQRIDAGSALIFDGATDPGHDRKILSDRTTALARKKDLPEQGEMLEILEFMLAGERYAFESVWVREVNYMRDLTPIPCTPPFILGVMNVRGRLLSITDLKKLFDLPDKGLGDFNRVIVLASAGMELGILADSILGVTAVPLAGMQRTVAAFTGIREEYLKGITTSTAILDATRLLEDRRIVVKEEVR